MLRHILLFSLLTWCEVRAQAQNFPVSYDFNFYGSISDSLYSSKHKLHTSIKPFGIGDTMANAAFEAVLARRIKAVKPNFVLRKLFNEHLVQYYKPDYALYFDFYPDFQVGRAGAPTYLNTRGFQLGGRIGSQITFQTNLFEDQGRFPQYVSDFIRSSRVVPGQGYARPYGKNGFDFGYTDGYLSYTPGKYFTFQIGHGRNFIGDGYRSLLLSDVSFSYPFIKIITTVGPFKYMNLWTQMQYINASPFTDSTLFPKKYSVYQYLDWAIGHHVNVGIFQNTMIRPRGFDLNFINPLIFIRPTEFNIGNPDKSTIGFTGSYKFLEHYQLYSQIVINEFTVSKVFGDPGYYANKQGFQLGGRVFNLFKISHLNALLEYNAVRPFTYTAVSSIIAYAHYAQPLGDILGTNFRESIVIASYSWKRFNFRAQFLHALRGLDDPTKPFQTTGGDLFKPYAYRLSNEGYLIGSGIRTNLYYADLRASYTLNYKNNLRFELGYTRRDQSNVLGKSNTNYFTLGIKGSFRNLYYDF